jgi:hypothetical protein
MATVWAYREGAFSRTASTGWSHTINFTSPSDLATQMDAASLRGRVQRLVILAHGNRPGQLLMEGTRLGATSAAVIGRLYAPFLRSDAMLVLMACIAGAGDDGSLFLRRLSTELRGRVIVGFSAYGVIDSSFGGALNPGNVQAAPGQRPVSGARLEPWSPWAKWAHEDVIVRLPADEQESNAGHRCANPNCRGHAATPARGRVPTLPHCQYSDWGHAAVLTGLNP